MVKISKQSILPKLMKNRENKETQIHQPGWEKKFLYLWASFGFNMQKSLDFHPNGMILQMYLKTEPSLFRIFIL
jgi:hypothetical protein